MRKLLLILLTILCCAFTSVSCAAKEENTVVENVEKISISEMDTRLAAEITDALYVKFGDEEGEVAVYHDTAKNRSLRKQIVLTAPNSIMIKLYTNDKKTFKQMSKMLSNYENDGKSFDGYRIITDVDNEKILSDTITVYRFWFMKIQKEKGGTRFPVGIGIGIGGGHHHGPWIGIGL